MVLSWKIWTWMSQQLKHFELNPRCMSRLVQFIPSGHRSLCKLGSVLFLTPISQTLPEGSQQESPDENVWSAELSLPGHWAGQEREKWFRPPRLPAPLPLPLPALLSFLPPHCFISQLMSVCPDLCHYNLWLFPLFISHFQKYCSWPLQIRTMYVVHKCNMIWHNCYNTTLYNIALLNILLLNIFLCQSFLYPKVSSCESAPFNRTFWKLL